MKSRYGSDKRGAMNRREDAKALGSQDSCFAISSIIVSAAEPARVSILRLPLTAGINPTGKAAKRITIAGGES